MELTAEEYTKDPKCPICGSHSVQVGYLWSETIVSGVCHTVCAQCGATWKVAMRPVALHSVQGPDPTGKTLVWVFVKDDVHYVVWGNRGEVEDVIRGVFGDVTFEHSTAIIDRCRYTVRSIPRAELFDFMD